MGRKTTLTPLIHKRIVEAVAVGVPIKMAAEGAGVGERSVYNWIEKAEKGNKKYVRFWQELQKAKANQVKWCLEKITHEADKGTWQAAAWILERKYPQEFGRLIHDHQGTIVNRHEYLIALRIANDEDTVEAIHRSIEGSQSLMRDPGRNGSSHQ